MLHISRQMLNAVLICSLLGLTGCAGEMIEEGYYDPDSRAAEAWRDEHTGNGENLGPNSPGYTGPDGQYSLYPDDDPH
ncbi:hypothetical protein [Methyloprofundus sp.]|uniref:hypothetical protein n=1 Tax=Methyloprofundus sp. TaxID=2020875 RepID=UPI003D0A0131